MGNCFLKRQDTMIFIAKIIKKMFVVRVVDKPEKYLFMFFLQVHCPNLFASPVVGI